MHEFIVTVTCVLHLNCMIPGGVKIVKPFPDIQSCEQSAGSFIAQMGGNPREFHVSCRQK